MSGEIIKKQPNRFISKSYNAHQLKKNDQSGSSLAKKIFLSSKTKLSNDPNDSSNLSHLYSRKNNDNNNNNNNNNNMFPRSTANNSYNSKSLDKTNNYKLASTVVFK